MNEELHRLIGEAKRGGKEAFANLVQQYKDRVYRHAFGMLGDRMEAEDVSQEAFIKVYYSLPRLENEYAFSSWLIQIVSNLCKDRIKKKGQEREMTNKSMDEAAVRTAPDNYARLTIEDLLLHLNPDHREVILLHDVQRYRYEEIAQILDIPVGTVKSRIHSARLALRNEMKKGDE